MRAMFHCLHRPVTDKVSIKASVSLVEEVLMALACTFVCYLAISLFISGVCVPAVVFTMACVVCLFIRKRYFVPKNRNLNTNRIQTNNRFSDSEDRYVPMSKINFLKSKQEIEERNHRENVPKNRYDNFNDMGHTYAPLTLITTVHESKIEKSKEVYYEVMNGRV